MDDDDALAEAGEDFSGVHEWQEAAAIAASAGVALSGLPRGLRVRSSRGKRAQADDEDEEKPQWKSQLPSRHEVGLLAFFLLLCGIMFALILSNKREGVQQVDVPPECKQCRQEWWRDFWRWRLHGLETQTAHLEQAPEGMEWEWGESHNDTDWFGVSAELVDKVVAPRADPELGPVLHVGCGDSPMPELLYRAGYRAAVHIDIVPQIVSAMRQRYPTAEWPGMEFAVRDFLAPPEIGGGAPPPLHRFAAVIDKAGIWDWLQDEASFELPKLLSRVRDALLDGPQKGVYIVVTKQSPMEMSETLAQARAQFVVETSLPLGSKGVAWSYVLEPL